MAVMLPVLLKITKFKYCHISRIIAGAFSGAAVRLLRLCRFFCRRFQQLTLKFMREHEEEADRYGISYLVSAATIRSYGDFS